MPLPKNVKPMLCTLVDRAFDDDNWIFEPKLDGLRVLCFCEGRTITLLSRNNKPQEVAFPEIVVALQEQVKKPAILDGEIVCLDERGWPSFKDLQQRFHLSERATIEKRMREYPAYIYLFDILYFEKKDVRPRPLEERKKVLKSAVKRWKNPVFWTDSVRGAGKDLLDATCRNQGEGIVAKKLDSPYVEYRSGYWLKIKCSGRQEFVIGGFTEPRGSRQGFGAILVGYYDEAGDLQYAGKVGTGFNNAMLNDLRKKFDKLEVKQRPFANGRFRNVGTAHWIKPKLVGEIGFAEWTRHGILRQPRFEGLREDKKPTDVRREKPKAATKVKRAATS